MFDSFINILFALFFVYCAFCVCYLFLLSISGRFLYKNNKAGNIDSGKMHSIALLVPAYKEDGIILSTAKNLLNERYPRELFDIYIIADSFHADTIRELNKLPIQVLEVAFEKSTKTKALNAAFSVIKKQYDIALICDADNMLAGDFLQKINQAFNEGERAVQGSRVAKNFDTPFAILDACSEAINNHIFRKGSNGLGLSSSVIGSGMAFEFDRIKDILAKIQAVGGFDKIVQLKMLEQGIKIRYLNEALVFDEKVASSVAFEHQRRRWVSSQFIYFKQFFIPATKQLFKGNFSYFHLAILCNIILPRAFWFLILPILIVLGFLISNTWGFAAVGLLTLYLLTMVISIPPEMFNKSLRKALLSLPKAITVMLGTLFQIKKANKAFIHTVHTKTEVTNTIYKENKN